MSRHKNVAWSLPDSVETWEQVNTAILMDIRDELHAIRMLMECPNVSAGFRAMQSVDRRLSRVIVTRRPAANKRRITR